MTYIYNFTSRLLLLLSLPKRNKVKYQYWGYGVAVRGESGMNIEYGYYGCLSSKINIHFHGTSRCVLVNFRAQSFLKNIRFYAVHRHYCIHQKK
uniref:Uncharacterized protein n=1 Tax=Escherichia coli TaxID=562 RepID=H9AXQ2_ECOLX|nr:hypothetical protein nmec31_9 [Escherichia coli]